MSAYKHLLAILFLVLAQHCFSQKTFDITLSLDSTINSNKIFCSYEDGKDTVYLQNKFVNNICNLTGEFHSKFILLRIDYTNLNGNYCSNLFSINERPAKIHLTYNNSANETRLNFDNLKNANPELDSAIIKLNQELFTFRKKEAVAVANLFEKHQSEIGRNDSITLLSQKLYKALNDRTILFLRKHPKDYFSFWYFRDQVAKASMVLMPGDTTYFRSLLNTFKSIFPTSYTNSFEGKELANKLEGLIKAKEANKFALPFSIKDMAGNMISLSDFKGQYILLDFWASWCPPCRINNPLLKRINEKYKKSNFKLISISADEVSDRWKDAVKKDSMNWLNVSDLKGINSKVAIEYGITAYPTYILVDPSGKIILRTVNEIENMQAKIEKIFDPGSVTSISNAQNPEKLLQASYAKCLTIKNGYYEMNMKWKFMDSKDTSWNLDYKFFFNKIENDSIYPIAFNSERYSHGNYFDNTLYTGNDFVTYSKTGKTASIMTKDKWNNKISDLTRNYTISFYSPFTSNNGFPLPTTSDYAHGKHDFKFFGNEMINNLNCYHIQEIEFPKFDSSAIVHTLKMETDYWINSADKIPVKYSTQSTLLRYGDTLTEYQSHTLKKYVLNNAKNLDALQISAIPFYCKISDYTEAKKLALLEKNSSAPDWHLPTVTGEKISLSGFKGKLVLIDFFYKNCYSCMKAIPALDSLYVKYKNNGLQVIGIDPEDSLNKAIKHFISKSGIDYPVVFAETKKAAKDYRVAAYPTTYLIDKNGKIIYGSLGFDESMKGKLEELIKSNL